MVAAKQRTVKQKEKIQNFFPLVHVILRSDSQPWHQAGWTATLHRLSHQAGSPKQLLSPLCPGHAFFLMHRSPGLVINTHLVTPRILQPQSGSKNIFHCSRAHISKGQRLLPLLLIFQNSSSPMVLCLFLHQVEALSLWQKSNYWFSLLPADSCLLITTSLPPLVVNFHLQSKREKNIYQVCFDFGWGF